MSERNLGRLSVSVNSGIVAPARRWVGGKMDVAQVKRMTPACAGMGLANIAGAAAVADDTRLRGDGN